MTNLEDVFLVDDAAAFLGVTPKHVRDLARAGKFPGAELRRTIWLIPREGIEHFLANRKPVGRPITTGAGLRRKDRRETKTTNKA